MRTYVCMQGRNLLFGGEIEINYPPLAGFPACMRRFGNLRFTASIAEVM